MFNNTVLKSFFNKPIAQPLGTPGVFFLKHILFKLLNAIHAWSTVGVHVLLYMIGARKKKDNLFKSI